MSEVTFTPEQTEETSTQTQYIIKQNTKYGSLHSTVTAPIYDIYSTPATTGKVSSITENLTRRGMTSEGNHSRKETTKIQLTSSHQSMDTSAVVTPETVRTSTITDTHIRHTRADTGNGTMSMVTVPSEQTTKIAALETSNTRNYITQTRIPISGIPVNQTSLSVSSVSSTEPMSTSNTISTGSFPETEIFNITVEPTKITVTGISTQTNVVSTNPVTSSGSEMTHTTGMAELDKSYGLSARGLETTSLEEPASRSVESERETRSGFHDTTTIIPIGLGVTDTSAVMTSGNTPGSVSPGLQGTATRIGSSTEGTTTLTVTEMDKQVTGLQSTYTTNKTGLRPTTEVLSQATYTFTENEGTAYLLTETKGKTTNTPTETAYTSTLSGTGTKHSVKVTEKETTHRSSDGDVTGTSRVIRSESTQTPTVPWRENTHISPVGRGNMTYTPGVSETETSHPVTETGSALSQTPPSPGNDTVTVPHKESTVIPIVTEVKTSSLTVIEPEEITAMLQTTSNLSVTGITVEQQITSNTPVPLSTANVQTPNSPIAGSTLINRPPLNTSVTEKAIKHQTTLSSFVTQHKSTNEERQTPITLEPMRTGSENTIHPHVSLIEGNNRCTSRSNTTKQRLTDYINVFTLTNDITTLTTINKMYFTN